MGTDAELMASVSKYTLKVAKASGAFVSSFSDACAHQFRGELSETIHPNTIRAICNSVDPEQVLNVDSATKVFRCTYALHKWIAAPEAGLRALIRECLHLYEPSLRDTCESASKIISTAAKAAFEKSAKDIDLYLRELMLEKSLYVIDMWKEDTLKLVLGNLHAEAEFPSPERFSKLRRRLQELLQEETKQALLRKIEELKRQIHEATIQLQEIDKEQRLLSQSSETQRSLMKGLPVSHAIMSQRQATTQSSEVYSQYFMGWIDKRSRKGTWQRRWVAISSVQQRIWYFGAPQEQPARGAGSLQGALLYIDGNTPITDYTPDMNHGNETGIFRVVFAASDEPIMGGAEDADDDNIGALNFMSRPPYINLQGRRTKRLKSLIFRAATLSSKEQWIRMILRGIAGEQPNETNRIQPLTALDDGKSSPVERKISTRVFSSGEEGTSRDEYQKEGDLANTRQGPKQVDDANETESIGGITDPDEEKEELSEEERNQVEQSLFDEISQQASSISLSNEELKVLECCIQAAREYITDSLGSITEQAGRVIQDGLLPVGSREEDMRGSLLELLIPQSGEKLEVN